MGRTLGKYLKLISQKLNLPVGVIALVIAGVGLLSTSGFLFSAIGLSVVIWGGAYLFLWSVYGEEFWTAPAEIARPKDQHLTETIEGPERKFDSSDNETDTRDDLKEVKGVKKRVKRSKEEWAAIVAEASETSVAKTAKKHGIATSQIYSWKSKLG